MSREHHEKNVSRNENVERIETEINNVKYWKGEQHSIVFVLPFFSHHECPFTLGPIDSRSLFAYLTWLVERAKRTIGNDQD